MTGFALLAASAVAVGAQPVPASALLQPTALPLRLTGIVLDADRPARSACLVRCDGQPDRGGLFKIGERACDVAVIREVRQDAVVIENLGTSRLELLRFQDVRPQAASWPSEPEPVEAAPPPGPIPVDLSKETVQSALANLPELLSSALAVPRYRDAAGGQRVIEGFEVTQVAPSGAAERLGLRNGDVILDVNGQVLDGMATVLRLFDQLQAEPQLTITVLRGGQRMSVVLSTK